MQWLPLIQTAVSELDTFLKNDSWHGRENEVVNLFAHRFLASAISPAGPLRSLRQVGIEVAVRQVGDVGKEYVRKDLVIWPAEDMTVWSGDGVPSVIIEWKANDPNQCTKDADWLTRFCCENPKTIGFSVCAVVKGPNRGCHIFKVIGSAA
jgi:hypothetical protein